ncbi:MAG: hypothetical protein QM811_03830 [Pirellulales bacterium]
MVGRGTGIAPFRVFLQERRAQNAVGKNWLFFGDQYSATDHLYQDVFAEYQASGLHTRVETACSRDQAEKVHVQTRMREQAPKSSAGSKKERRPASEATPNAWRSTWTPRCARLSLSTVQEQANRQPSVWSK